MITIRDVNDLTLKSDYDTLKTTVEGTTTKVGRLDGSGTGNNVVLGGATVASGTTNQTIISGPIINSVSTTFLRWDGANRSAIQSIGTSAPVTPGADTVCLTYGTTPKQLTATVSYMNGATAEQFSVVLPAGTMATQYREMFNINVTTNLTTMNVTDYPNKFCVYTPPPAMTGSQQLKLPSGLAPGTEIEIFNNSAASLEIVTSDATANYLAGTIRSVSSNKMISSYGAAVVKVFTLGNLTAGPVFFLIGSLVSA